MASVVDVTLEKSVTLTPAGSRMAGTVHTDRAFGIASLICALLVVAVFAGIIGALIYGAWPAIRTFGLSFLWTTTWNPVTQKFGAVAPVLGTLITSAIAMLIAVPIGIGTAVFLTELCPRRLRQPFGIAIELLAGIPSIIYGIWGLFFLAPFLQAYILPPIIDTFDGIPVLEDFFGGPPIGIGLFTSGLILAIMILPIFTAVTRDVFLTVPAVLKEAAYGLGSTKWEVQHDVVLPYARAGMVGAMMLALGRALGETMAVTFVIGNAHNIPQSLFAPATTISASLANEFTEALGPLYGPSLVELGLILFFVTFVVLGSARFMLYRLEKRAGAR
jgi:phosphate transport system permease protein